MSTEEILFRLAAATLAGIILGIDREMRGIAAGVRTHALVALSSGLITISAMMIHEDFRQQGHSGVDPLRVVQGLAQAVGFVAAGAIFFSKGSVRNLTSAANIWLAAAVGIAAGAGQLVLVAAGVGIGIVLITLMRVIERIIPGTTKSADDPNRQASD